MADTQITATQPTITDDELLAERVSSWSSFTGAVFVATSVVVAIVVAMAIFLV